MALHVPHVQPRRLQAVLSSWSGYYQSLQAATAYQDEQTRGAGDAHVHDLNSWIGCGSVWAGVHWVTEVHPSLLVVNEFAVSLLYTPSVCPSGHNLSPTFFFLCFKFFLLFALTRTSWLSRIYLCFSWRLVFFKQTTISCMNGLMAQSTA